MLKINPYKRKDIQELLENGIFDVFKLKFPEKSKNFNIQQIRETLGKIENGVLPEKDFKELIEECQFGNHDG